MCFFRVFKAFVDFQKGILTADPIEVLYKSCLMYLEVNPSKDLPFVSSMK